MESLLFFESVNKPVGKGVKLDF